MRKFIRIATRLVAVVAISVLLIQWDSYGWWPVASALGKLSARADVAREHYRVLTYGIANPMVSSYSNLLHQRYGVEFQAVAGCIVSKALVDYVTAYNEVSMAAVNNKFGRNIFKEIYNVTKENGKQSDASKAAN